MEHPLDELHTISDFIRWCATQFNKAQLFFGHGTDNAVDEAATLVLYALHLAPEIPAVLWHAQLTHSEKQVIVELLNRRIQERIPIPYLTHEAWFAHLRFYVDRRVLIPRSPIAELIEQRFEPWVQVEQIERMLDLCTGSGCIAIASAMLAFPQAEIDAIDISSEALEVAQKNVENYGLEHRVHTLFSDLFARLSGKQYDLIVCNPPYADAQELQNMPEEYHYEPKVGLAAGQDGLLLVKRILRQAAPYLTSHGVLIVEVGLSQNSLIAEYPDVPFMWLEFQRGGEGVFLLTAEQLRLYAQVF